MRGPEIDRLIQLLAKLPGLGPRSARRAALHLIKKRESLLDPLARALADAAERLKLCRRCGNLDTADPCGICTDGRRDGKELCVVEDIADLWALERTGACRGRYHILGGRLSALEGVGPEALNLPRLIERVQSREGGLNEVVLALGATVDGQTTAHYIAERLQAQGVRVSELAHGVPVGGELDYLDDGTIAAAFRARRQLGSNSG
jgi:recombination protein RecR